MVIGIGYVNVPGFIRRQAIWVVEARGAPGAIDASEGSSCAGKACHYSRRSNFTNGTIICVGHVNSGTAQRHAARIIETSHAPGAVGTAYTTHIVGLGPRQRGHCTGGSNFADLLVIRIGHVNRAGTVG
jgi:hypothetical protein